MSEQHSEEIFARGKIFELVRLPQPDGQVYEVARRAPGVRLIIHDETAKKILLTKEFRRELNDWDYRLPGGKVFDLIEEFDAFRQSGKDIAEAASGKVLGEGSEEAGVTIEKSLLFKVSTLGATVEWDLYVFEVNEWTQAEGQQLEQGEQIEKPEWFSYADLKQMILRGDMKEERVALILLQWLEQKGSHEV